MKKRAIRNPTIDVLKGICIIFVLIEHYAWIGGEQSHFLFPYWVRMAVPMFMIISGYVSAASYERNNVQSLSDAYRIEFLLKKTIRFTIPFLLVFVIEIIMGILLGGGKAYLRELFTNFNFFILFLNGGLGPGSYYYPIMMQFIVVFPIIYCVVKSKKTLGFVLCLLANAIFEILQYSYGMNEECYRLLLFRYIMYIAFGCFIYENFEKKFSASWGIISLTIGICFILFFVYGTYKPIFIVYWTSTCWVAGLYILPISVYLIKAKIRCYVLELLGKASYNIFLVQMVYYHFFAAKIYQKIERRRYELLANISICIITGLFFFWAESKLTSKIIKWSENLCKQIEKRDILEWFNQQLLRL